MYAIFKVDDDLRFGLSSFPVGSCEFESIVHVISATGRQNKMTNLSLCGISGSSSLRRAISVCYTASTSMTTIAQEKKKPTDIP